MSDRGYTAEQLERRNRSRWTIVQAVLAPLQFLVFLISLILVVRYLMTGNGYGIATVSVLIKIALLWLITVTGAFWEKEVFGHWFMAPQFFWEDLVNAIALLMHNFYFVARGLGWSERAVMTVMLVAYLSYIVNMIQFTWRGVRARKQAPSSTEQAAMASAD